MICRIFGSVTKGYSARARLALCCGGALLPLMPAMAQAQTAPAAEEAQPAPAAPAAVGNEIIVTATKRSQTLQNVPVAVTVTSRTTLDRAVIRNVSDLSSVVPSLRVEQEQTSANTSFYIRGFGNGANNVGVEPSVGVFIDGVYRSRVSASLSDFPDVERIEVLRGPQSTLFGKNASAGVISITTTEPQFKTSASIEGTVENFNGKLMKGVMSGPISDTLAVGVSAGVDTRDGYVKDATTGNTLNNRDRWFARGQLLWKPSSQFKLRLIADYDHINELCCAVVNVRASGATQVVQALGGKVNSAADPFADVVYQNFDPTNHIQNYGFSGQADYDAGPLKLTSITSYRHNSLNTNADADFSSADLIGTYGEQQSTRTFTQELRLASNLPGPFNFLLGAFYFDEHINDADQLRYGTQFAPYANQLIQAASGGTMNLTGLEQALGQSLTGNPAYFMNTPGNTHQFFGPGQGTDEHYTLADRSLSIFAQGDYKITPRLTLTGGINYTHDTKDYTTSDVSSDVFSNLNLPAIVNGGIAQACAAHGAPGAAAAAAQLVPLLGLMPLQFIPSTLGVPNAVEPGKTSDGNVSWTARAAYEASKQVKFYVSASSGFKASSVNLSRNSLPAVSDSAALVAAGLAPPPSVAITATPYTINYPAYGSRAAGPEHSYNYEAGMKANWGTGTLNVAVFKEIIKGFQSNLFTGTGFFLANAGQESNWGIEAEGTLRPTRELTLSAAVNWYNANYDSFVLSSVGNLTGTKPADITPWTINLGVQDVHPMGNGDHLILRAGWHYESKTQLVDGLPGEVVKNPLTQAVISDAPAIALAQQFTRTVSQIDASITYSFRTGVDLMVWARNLNNQRYLMLVFDSPAQSGSISGYPSEPRTFGATARVKW